LKAKLYPYERYSVTFVEEHDHAGLFLDMGLGKTLITLTALKELRDMELLPQKVLIIAPKKVAQDTWPKEIAKWDTFKDLTYSVVLGTPQAREQALAVSADIYITNRENIVWLADKYKKRWPFKTVVIDELSSFKSSKSKRFKALKKLTPLIDRLIGLTGTPAPNGLLDLWPQLYLLDRGDRLGKTVTQYRNTYFYPAEKSGHVVYSWALIPGGEDLIYKKISDICVSMKSEDYLNLPARINETVYVDLTKAQRQKYNQLKKDYVLPVNSGEEVSAANAAVMAGKLAQLANGAIYTTDMDGNKTGRYAEFTEAKLDALEDIYEQANGQPVLVFYRFKHDRERILKRFNFAVDLTSDNITDWNAGRIPLMIAQPQSSGHGLNLQAGGHIVVWFGLTWSLEQYQQANKRLDRQGQTKPVTVYHILTRGTIDEYMKQVIEQKALGQDELLAAVKAELAKQTK